MHLTLGQYRVTLVLVLGIGQQPGLDIPMHGSLLLCAATCGERPSAAGAIVYMA